MYLKFRMGWLPAFQPYHSLQATLGQLIGRDVPAIAPWVMSFLNGSSLLSFIFGRAYRLLPGSNGATKGMVFGFFGWAVMGLVLFPLLGLGAFAGGLGLGLAPALFSLAMLLAYSVVLGVVYSALMAPSASGSGRTPR